MIECSKVTSWTITQLRVQLYKYRHTLPNMSSPPPFPPSISSELFVCTLGSLTCLLNVALRPQKQGCLLGTGTKEWRLDCGYHPKKTVDRHQNNGSVKAVSFHHCPATSALCNCCFNCCAWAVTKTMSVAPLLRNNSKQKKSSFHSPAPPHYSWSLLG